jgi:hypothetical protein
LYKKNGLVVFQYSGGLLLFLRGGKTLEENRSIEEIRYEYYLKVLEEEITQYKYIRIPVLDISMQTEELFDWMAETLPPNEIKEIFTMIKEVKERKSNIKPLLQTLALGILKNFK